MEANGLNKFSSKRNRNQLKNNHFSRFIFINKPAMFRSIYAPLFVKLTVNLVLLCMNNEAFINQNQVIKASSVVYHILQFYDTSFEGCSFVYDSGIISLRSRFARTGKF